MPSKSKSKKKIPAGATVYEAKEITNLKYGFYLLKKTIWVLREDGKEERRREAVPKDSENRRKSKDDELRLRLPVIRSQKTAPAARRSASGAVSRTAYAQENRQLSKI